jgi:serine/threonine-protein kinase RsbW
LSTQTFKKVFQSDPELLPEIEEFVIEMAIKAGIDENKMNNLALSVAEASSNSIIHGNSADPNKNVVVDIKIDDKYFYVTFKDEGKGFKLDEVPDPTAPENILKDHGRGIHIMRSFLDDLKYKFTPEGTEVTLVISLI